jgi:hypothetical protein
MTAALDEAYAERSASQISKASHRYHVYHRSAPRFGHLRDRKPKCKERAEVIDAHLIPKLLDRCGCHRAIRVTGAACVVEQDVKSPKTSDRLSDCLLDRFWFSYITQLEHGLTTRSHYTACYCFTLGDSATRNHDASPLPSKHFGTSLADPTRRSHQKSAFVFQSFHF